MNTARQNRQVPSRRVEPLNRVTIAVLPAAAVIGAWAVAMVLNKAGSPAGGGLSLVLVLVSVLMIYLLPTIVAWCLHHPHLIGICLINVAFGWTLIGWMGSMVWSVVPVAPVDRRSGMLVRSD